jgi:hypothetical protein
LIKDNEAGRVRGAVLNFVETGPQSLDWITGMVQNIAESATSADIEQILNELIREGLVVLSHQGYRAINPSAAARRAEIAKVIESRGATLPCPRCANQRFQILSGYVCPPLQQTLEQMTLGVEVVPTAAVVCVQCGYLALHALGPLGLLPGRPL